MSVKIKKVVRDAQGNVLEEYEGTESEIEAYENKRKKREQSEAKVKEKRLLLESQKTLDKLTKKDLLEIIEKILAQRATTVEHHWYHHNGYWWRPWWDGINWIYTYTNQNPNLGYAVSTNTAASITDLTKTTGIGVSSIYSSMVADQGNLSGGSNSWGSAFVSSGPVSNYTMQVGDPSPSQTISKALVDQNSITSGIVNMNIKS